MFEYILRKIALVIFFTNKQHKGKHKKLKAVSPALHYK